MPKEPVGCKVREVAKAVGGMKTFMKILNRYVPEKYSMARVANDYIEAGAENVSTPHIQQWLRSREE